MRNVKGNKTDMPTQHDSNDEFRFDLHKDTSPYSGARESRAGSGSTGGAGYGNKTGSFGTSSGGKYPNSLSICLNSGRTDRQSIFSKQVVM